MLMPFPRYCILFQDETQIENMSFTHHAHTAETVDIPALYTQHFYLR